MNFTGAGPFPSTFSSTCRGVENSGQCALMRQVSASSSTCFHHQVTQGLSHLLGRIATSSGRGLGSQACCENPAQQSTSQSDSLLILHAQPSAYCVCLLQRKTLRGMGRRAGYPGTSLCVFLSDDNQTCCVYRVPYASWTNLFKACIKQKECMSPVFRSIKSLAFTSILRT